MRQGATGGQVFYKLDDGTTTNWRLLSDGSGWFKADIYDPVSTALPTGTSATLDGVLVQEDDLVYFTNLGANNDRLYRVTGVGTSLVWTALPIFGNSYNPSAGDSIRVIKGVMFAGQTVYYDGSTHKVNDIVRFFDGDNGTDYYEQGSIKTLTLDDNDDTEVFIVAVTGSENINGQFSIKRGTKKETGFFTIAHNGIDAVSAATFDTYTDPSVGATFNASTVEAADVPSDVFAALGTAFDNTVYAMARQADGKLLVGGAFTTYQGDASTPAYLCRLNADYTIDTTFNYAAARGFSDPVRDIKIQSDNKIVVGGDFTTYTDGVATPANCPDYLARINTDGTLDQTFNYGVGTRGFDSIVRSIALQGDGKIIAGGAFASYDGDTQCPNSIARINTDGTLDTTFNYGAGTRGFIGQVYAVALQTDEKIIAGGLYTAYNGDTQCPDYLARVNTDGTLDTTFNYGAGTRGFDNTVFSAAIQDDGKIIAGGIFAAYNGDAQCPDGIARINTDGTLDTTFNYGAGSRGFVGGLGVYTISLQPDGKIVAGGAFTSYDGNAQCPDAIARINADGTIDTAFNYGAGTRGFTGAPIYRIVLDETLLLIGGSFSAYNFDSTPYVANNFIALYANTQVSLSINLDNQGTDATLKYFLTRWSDGAGGPAGAPSYSANVSTVAAAGAVNDIQYHGGGGNLAGNSLFQVDVANNAISLNGLKLGVKQGPNTIIDNQVAPTLLVLLTPDTFDFLWVKYSILRGGETQTGMLLLSNNGTTVAISDQNAPTAALGIVFSADLSGGYIRLLYTSTSTGNNGTFYYSVDQW